MVESRAPLVEMLWEAHDPRGALKARFGFSDADVAGRWVAATLAEYWGVRIDSCDRIVISDLNALAWVGTPLGRLVAKWSVASDRFARLEEIARLTRWLDGQGVPVSAPVPARDGRIQIEVDGASIGVQRQIEGKLLDVANLHQVGAAGAVLARLQDALAAYPDAERVPAMPDSSQPLRPLTVRVTNWLDSGAQHLPATVRDTLRLLVADAPPDRLPTQLGHWDFRSANILCVGAEVAAILDFEQIRRDHRVVELARSAVMLGTRFRNWGPVVTRTQNQATSLTHPI